MKTLTISTIAVALVLSAITSNATIISVGSSFNLPTPETPHSTTLVAPQYTDLYNAGSGLLVGSVVSWVAQDPANPLGGLSFYYQIHNTGANTVEGLSFSGFGSLNLDAAYISTSGNVAPSFVSRLSDTDKTIHWYFSGIATGQDSDILVINTDINSYGLAPGSVQDTFSDNIEVYAAVPEPSTIVAGALLLLPFGAGAFRSIRKNRV